MFTVPSGNRNNQKPPLYQPTSFEIENPGPQFDFQEEFSKPQRKYPNSDISGRPGTKTTTNYAEVYGGPIISLPCGRDTRDF